MTRWMLIAGCMVVLAGCGGGDVDVARQAAKLDLPEGVGSVCGRNGLLGVEIGNVPGPGACGVSSAVRLYAASGVRLRGTATLNCTTATALDDWINEGAQPAVAPLKARIESLKVAAHYACRNRNNASRGRLSEHAKGNAIDISSLTLDDGRKLSVLNDWRAAKTGPVMKELHASACGPFGTVLGPKSDRHHQDHFHFDVASYRSGPYCK